MTNENEIEVDGIKYVRVEDKKQDCDDCHADITAIGGWQFPQEPKKFYCTDCQSRRFYESLERKRG